ncbi:hypothetical protein BCR42DRAFT_430012 [Absidia repens]|uniref:BHLH domain-containing protein n=1 Tax=Absidia repens TaxID=90262 RepID=A0A1X2HKK9_9FUNG|nr:hypothetical protein BCR42DRAFT_430012 [Absidia repens]
MAFFMEYDESYIAGHKASSISSTDSGDHPPSLYTGHADSCSSLCDPDELRELPVFEDPSPYEPVKLSQRTSISILWMIWQPHFTKFIRPESTSHDDTVSTFESKKEETSSNSLPLLPVSTPAPTSGSVPTTVTQHQPTVLTKSEKRVNHIASEQKRRQNIRTGFQQLTDLIPSLKNMPHSKSTILFKTADYIKHSEKRNKVLQERLKHLQRRVALSTNAISAATPYYNHHASSSLSTTNSLSASSSSSSLPIQQASSLSLSSASHRRPSSSSMYSSTQLQIRRLQQQLLHQQELLLQHNIPHQPIITSPSSHYHQQHPPNAIVMPMSSDNDPLPVNSTPCLNIPADDEFGQESMLRERLLSCGKLNLNRTIG